MFEQPVFLFVLYTLGLALFIAEVFVPSGGIIGALALLCTGTAIFMMFWHDHMLMGFIAVVVLVVYLVVLILWWLRWVTSTADLSEAKSTGRDVEAATELIGEQGEVVTALRPAGVASIGGRRFDVVSRGNFIEVGTRVQVVETKGNRIVVRKAT